MAALLRSRAVSSRARVLPPPHCALIRAQGIGKDHAKWSPVATAVFRYQPAATLQQSIIRRMTPEQRAEWAASDPNQILKYDPDSREVSLGDVEAYAYDNEAIQRAQEMGFPGVRALGLRCGGVLGVPPARADVALAASSAQALEVVQKQDTFIFTVEATGALPPAEIVLNGARAAAHLLICAIAL
jgi:DNA-directed RNA polymerase II subunit RPB3